MNPVLLLNTTQPGTSPYVKNININLSLIENVNLNTQDILKNIGLT